MKKDKMSGIVIVSALAMSLLAGCTSSHKRTALIGAGTAGGGGLGYALAGSGHKGTGALIGATGGALATSLALGDDPEVYQRGLDEGYLLGSADSLKRLYWAKQDLERQRGGAGGGGVGSIRYYVWEDEGMASDGRKLAPERVAIPIYEPAPSP